MRKVAAALLCATLAASPAVSQNASSSTSKPAASPQITKRTAEVLAILQGAGSVTETFHPTFLAEVPPEKLATITAGLRTQYGAPLKITRLTPRAVNQAEFDVYYERGTAHMSVVLGGAEAAHKVTGFWITQVARSNDNFDSVTHDLDALPGRTALAIYRIDGEKLSPLVATGETQRLAVGSSFKLAILAALDADIRAGKRKWSDVVPLTHKSLPSGQLQNWPDRAPLTLYSLAALMISISDNSATDTLLHLIGRERVSAFATQRDMLDRMGLPMLSTLEAFVFKEPEHAALRQQWKAGSAAQRSALLDQHSRRWTTADTKGAMMAGTPQSIDTIEWFASPRQMANTLLWFARDGSPEARAILGINAGLPGAMRQGWRYVGFKGGSETGVIAANYLLTDEEGRNYIVSAAWNDSNKAVSTEQFFAIVNRAINTAAPK